jgi:AbrB family looped-hinge helix DNA binding protein
MMASMNATVTIDKAGRVVIPKPLRDELRLEPGDELDLEAKDGRVTLRPRHAATPLRKEHGVWTFHGRTKLSLAQANELVRATRERRAAGQVR